MRGERRILWNQLGESLEAHTDPRYAEALDALYSSPLTTVAITQLRTARRRESTSTLDLLELMASLHEQGILNTTANKSADAIRIVASMGVTDSLQVHG